MDLVAAFLISEGVQPSEFERLTVSKVARYTRGLVAFKKLQSDATKQQMYNDKVGRTQKATRKRKEMTLTFEEIDKKLRG